MLDVSGAGVSKSQQMGQKSPQIILFWSLPKNLVLLYRINKESQYIDRNK
jgi:hypothetical protein